MVIVNWNRKGIYLRMLGRIKKTNISNPFNHIASEAGSLEVVGKNYPEAKTIALSENLDFAAGNNIALKNVRTKYFALVDNDFIAQSQRSV